MGRGPSRIVGKTAMELLPGAEAERTMAEDRDVLQSGKIQLSEVAPIGGHGRACLSMRSVFRNSDGEIAGTVEVAREISATVSRTE